MRILIPPIQNDEQKHRTDEQAQNVEANSGTQLNIGDTAIFDKTTGFDHKFLLVKVNGEVPHIKN